MGRCPFSICAMVLWATPEFAATCSCVHARPSRSRLSFSPVVATAVSIAVFLFYREHILNSEELLAHLDELEGKTLGCWCTPEERCQGDVLLELLRDRAS